MGLPTTAQASIEIDAPPEAIYDLVSDVTRMGEWSPECVRCEWKGTPGEAGSTFTGSNKSGLARWTTTAKVVTADRPNEFTFATQHKGQDATRWTYRFEPAAGTAQGTTVTESFESLRSPWFIALAERTVIRNRQQQLVDGMQRTLERIKRAAEADADRS